jgi:hypothetical protein
MYNFQKKMQNFRKQKTFFVGKLIQAHFSKQFLTLVEYNVELKTDNSFPKHKLIETLFCSKTTFKS